MTRDHLLVIDQGTTSTRAVVYDKKLKPVGQSQLEVLPTYPRSGWVEHDPDAILDSVGSTGPRALQRRGCRPRGSLSIGLTNQRETTIVWERGTGKPIAPALVWQDRRTAEACNGLKNRQAEVSRTNRPGDRSLFLGDQDGLDARPRFGRPGPVRRPASWRRAQSTAS